MERHWVDGEEVKTSLRSEGMLGHACWLLGAVFAVLGIIADAANTNLGLSTISWFLLAIAAFAASSASFISWAVAWYLKNTESKKEE